jgi:hypothetical protein
MQFLVSMGDSTTRDYSGSFEWTCNLRAPSLFCVNNMTAARRI